MNMLYPSAIMLIISVIMFSPALQAKTTVHAYPQPCKVDYSAFVLPSSQIASQRFLNLQRAKRA